MLFTSLTLLSLVVGSSSFNGEEQRRCYGESFAIDSDHYDLLRGWIYFIPSVGGPRKLLISNGMVKDSRFKVRGSTIKLKETTEKDDGIFYYSYDGDTLNDLVWLSVEDCAQDVMRSYKGKFATEVPPASEYLEFTPLLSKNAPRILWNKSDPQINKGGRGQVKNKIWELTSLTQADNGFYNFRGKDNTLQIRIKITVNEYTSYHDASPGEELTIPYPITFSPMNITFDPGMAAKKVWLMKQGRFIDRYSSNSYFNDRLRMLNHGVQITFVKRQDSGTFQFRDKEGNLVFTAYLKVNGVEQPPAIIFIAIIVAIILGVIACCCCCCCLRRRSAKRQSAAPRTAAAPVVNYYPTDRHEGTSYTAPDPAPAYSGLQLVPAATSEPTISPVSPMYRGIDVHVNPNQSEVPVPGGHGPAPGPSDFMPQFVLKGVSFPHMLPLTSDTVYSDVYTSDKLNFQ